VRTLILAAVTPDNTPHGYNITFAAPMLAFIIIGGVLYLLFSRPHRRIPARPVRLPAARPGAASTAVVHGATATATGAASATGAESATAAETSGTDVSATDASAADADGTEPSGTEESPEGDGTANGDAAKGTEDTE
jgi:hypothetical protein